MGSVGAGGVSPGRETFGSATSGGVAFGGAAFGRDGQAMAPPAWRWTSALAVSVSILGSTLSRKFKPRSHARTGNTGHGSIPHVAFVVLDLVFLQELTKLLLERFLSMMFTLFGDVAFEGR